MGKIQASRNFFSHKFSEMDLLRQSSPFASGKDIFESVGSGQAASRSSLICAYIVFSVHTLVGAA